ncbi:MAG: TIGR03960 family B12-binding radical SAM protein [Dehalococcoidia bacterium]|nr:TIGR03960 family B12-binding radical SAM protein [Dehalococcoidia bacterium]
MIPDSILSKVVKPARYTGGEWNMVAKDWESAEVKVALAYPDVYDIGMSNLGISILYDILNRQSGVLAERVYAPWVDLDAEMRQANLPLGAIESRRPVRDFDIVGFSIGYELAYTNVLNMLHLAQIPERAAERTDAHPLVIAGGSCALNPEPMADFIDLFVLGDGEDVIVELVDLFRRWKKGGAGRKEDFLRQAVALPGIYVPRFYEVSYGAQGGIAGFRPVIPEAPARIRRRLITKLPPPVSRPIVPYVQVVHDRGAIEIQRGCARGCRFCQAGMIYRPMRQRPPEEIVGAVGDLVSNCGYDEVSLLSLSTGDYPGIKDLIGALTRRLSGRYVSLSLPSLRLDPLSVELADSLPGRRKSGFTFAPEAGTDRLRRVINKTLPQVDLLQAIEQACQREWLGLKLYFMVGLPTETMEDIEGIVELVRMVRREGRKHSNRGLQVRVTVSTFIPKPHTPFQWLPMEREETLRPRIELLRTGLRKAGANPSWGNPGVSLLEAALSRGDRRLGEVIHRAWTLGCTFDAWNERLRADLWLKAFEDCGLSPADYAYRQLGMDEVLPWSHVDIGVSASFLRREYQRALKGEETADCRRGACAGCGLESQVEGCHSRFDPADGPPKERS